MTTPAYRLRDVSHALIALAIEREREGIRDYAIAERARVSRKQLSEWGNGHAIPRADRLFDLAHAHGFDLAFIPREDAQPEAAECGCPVTHERARVTRHTRECCNRQAAERLAAYIDREDA